MTPEQTVRRIGRRLIQWWTPLRIAGVVLLMLAFLVGILGYFNERELLYLTETAKQILKYLSANVSTELASIAITMLFVDALYEHRETEREKKRLILQMGSPDNAFAVEAVRALHLHRWLYDGSLKRANLMGANLQEADLRHANFQGAILVGANLQEADLEGANLQGANLGYANLQGTFLRGANLQKALLHGAKFQGANLGFVNFQAAILGLVNFQEANLGHANFQGANMGHANLQEAKYNNATRWPEGFTPPPQAINVDAETNVED